MELEILPPLGDPLTTPSAPPAPPVPSEYTRIISTPVRPSTVGAAGGGSATQPAPAPAPAAPKLEVPKIAAPGELPAPRKPSYLPLILLLNGVVLAAIALVVYFLLAR